MNDDAGTSRPPTPASATRHALHATAVAIGEAGVLIRGPSGAGKSSLALALLDLAEIRGEDARLVGDDRVLVAADAGDLVAMPHPALLGQIERRGFGIVSVPHLARTVVRLVVDFVDPNRGCDIPPRMPDATDRTTCVDGVDLPRMVLRSGMGSWDAALEVARTLRDMKSPH